MASIAWEFETAGWSSGPFQEAHSFFARWRGIRAVPAGCGVLLPGRSVHGFGLRESLLVIGLDRDDCVVRVARLKPGRVVGCRSAVRMLELRSTKLAPPVGASLIRVPRVI